MFESRAAVQQIAFPPGLSNNLQVEKFAIYDDVQAQLVIPLWV
jgi:hypothetical protein